jgi:hypothetical protein
LTNFHGQDIFDRLELEIKFSGSQEKKKKCQSLLNFIEEEKKKNEQEHTKIVSEKKHAVWKVEPMVKAIQKNNLRWFCFLIVLGGKLEAADLEYLVHKIEDESEKLTEQRYLINFLSKIKDQYDMTLLHHAAHRGKLKCLQIVIGYKLNVNERNSDEEQTSCLFTCKNGATKCANTIFEKNVSVNFYNLQRQTPLHLAAHEGHQECLELLIREGGDVNAKDEDDTTPLHYAVFFGKVDCLEVLLANGANVNARDKTQETPLHTIGLSKEGCKEEKERCAEMLINAGADIDARDEDGDTIFYYQFFQDLKVERPDLFTQN